MVSSCLLSWTTLRLQHRHLSQIKRSHSTLERSRHFNGTFVEQQKLWVAPTVSYLWPTRVVTEMGLTPTPSTQRPSFFLSPLGCLLPYLQPPKNREKKKKSPQLGNVSETPTPTTCLKSTAVHLQFVWLYAPRLYLHTFLASKLRRKGNPAVRLPFVLSTPPICRAVLLENAGGLGHRNVSESSERCIQSPCVRDGRVQCMSAFPYHRKAPRPSTMWVTEEGGRASPEPTITEPTVLGASGKVSKNRKLMGRSISVTCAGSCWITETQMTSCPFKGQSYPRFPFLWFVPELCWHSKSFLKLRFFDSMIDYLISEEGAKKGPKRGIRGPTTKSDALK